MMTASFYTYILECADGSYYVGKTADLDKRLRQHNGELSGGAKYTRSRRPVQLRFKKAYNTNALASQEEYKLKQLTHLQKEQLIRKSENS